MKMGVLLSPFLDEFAFAIALACVVAFVIFLAWFIRVCVPVTFALAFLVLSAFVVLAVARIEEPLLGLMML